MKLYHGSKEVVKNPDTIHSRLKVDFGRGFYATSIYEQAVKWADRFKWRDGIGIVSVYEFDESCLQSNNVLVFEKYTTEWLDFVVKCRRGEDATTYNIVMGGVANDNIFNTIELFYEGIITKEETIQRLRFEEPNMQICFRNQMIIDTYLHFEREVLI